jgi:hypothetical protein
MPGCGILSPPLAALNDNDIPEPACLDLWTPVHMASGYVMGAWLGDDSLGPTTTMLAGYELAEPHFWPGFNESQLNQACDVYTGALGWYIHELIEE